MCSGLGPVAHGSCFFKARFCKKGAGTVQQNQKLSERLFVVKPIHIVEGCFPN